MASAEQPVKIIDVTLRRFRRLSSSGSVSSPTKVKHEIAGNLLK